MDCKISIVTPSFNSEKTISNTIEAVLNQTFAPFEYYIIDGKSTDKTVEIAKSYVDTFNEKGIIYKVISEKDNGIFDAMNKGIDLCNGDIIGITNSDDFYELSALENVAKLYSRESFDIMYADLRICGAKKNIVKTAKIQKKFNTRYWNHPTTFVSKKVYNEFKYVGGNTCDDLNFMLTARERGKKIVIINEILANFAMGGVSNEKSWKKRGERIKLRNSIYKSHNCKGYKFNNWLIETAKYFLG